MPPDDDKLIAELLCAQQAMPIKGRTQHSGNWLTDPQ